MEDNNIKNEDAKTVSQPAKSKKDKKKEGKGFGRWFNEHKAEFKKIVWPGRKEVAKETTTVVIVSLLVGVIIFGMDTALNTGYYKLVDVIAGDSGSNASTDENINLDDINLDGISDDYDVEIVTGGEADANADADADVDANADAGADTTAAN